MDRVLQHYLDVLLPYRLSAIGAFEIALHLVKEYPEAVKIECTFNGKLRLQGLSTAITNPSIEMGIIHSRVLLEFLGIKAESEVKLREAKPRKGDVSIEKFGLQRVTIERATAVCNGDKVSVEAALARILTAANKLVAHSTALVQLDNDSIEGHLIACDAIRELFDFYFYQALGAKMPICEVDKLPRL